MWTYFHFPALSLTVKLIALVIILQERLDSHFMIQYANDQSLFISERRLIARLAQSVERKALNLVVVGSSPTVGAAAETLAAAPSGPAVAALRASLARAVRQGQAGGHIPWGRLRLDAPLRPGSRAPEGSARSQQLCHHRAQSLLMMSSAVHQEPAQLSR